MKGTPELKAKGIIIANNKQISNFKGNPNSQQLYESNKVDEPILGNLSNQNMYYQKQKGVGNFNSKPKGAAIQNQWFAANDSHQGSMNHKHHSPPGPLINPVGAMNHMTSPQNYLS